MDSPALVAAIAGAAGTIGAALFTLLDHLILHRSETQKLINESVRTEAEALRKDMREQMVALQDRVSACEKDREQLRNDYWTLFVKCQKLQVQVDQLSAK